MSEYINVMADGRIIKIMRQRDLPWSQHPIADAVASWKGTMDQYQSWLFDRGETLGLVEIDEIALLFANDFHKALWIRDAVSEPEVKLFNTASDHVTTQPIDSEYWVDYDFLEVRGHGDWRVECMTIDNGRSPLHDSILTDMDVNEFPLRAVHLSFPCDNVQEYLSICQEFNQEPGVVLAQSCSSDYGKFSYYKVWDLWNNVAALYLKPRVNLRDEDRGEFGMPGVGGQAVKDMPQA